ncbi:delta-1-pyrroline-5-carboxylate dehydrogenase [Ramicandelaber brevisporus]|nr:delta-1-pyrroline-5-carboxylate dehydrogenase [Ramicandelaber brevisporus]
MTAQLAAFKIPPVDNEPMPAYGPGTEQRAKLQAALEEMRQAAPFHVPIIINGVEHKTGHVENQPMPSEHAKNLCTYENADDALVAKAIDGALAAKHSWENLPANERMGVFLRAADLLSKKYRYQVMAATMLGQGKNVWQAEIDSAAEACDFMRFNCKYAEELYAAQPPKNQDGVWNRVEYRPLEGFVYAVSPFNFTAIGANLAGAPALMGNVVVWKPAPNATYASYLIYKIFEEAGLPAGVIQFVPGPAPEVTAKVLAHPEFAALHFTGSTFVFKKLWKDIAANLDVYKSYPRIVGETGGKNFHLLHPTADVKLAVAQTIRSAFEYQGQKCSACSRAYVPASLWPAFQDGIVAEHARIKVGPVHDFTNFVGPVINKVAFDRIASYIDYVKAHPEEATIIAGGKYDDSVGYFIEPTVVVAKSPKFRTLVDEIFGPVVTIYVYEDADLDTTVELVDKSTAYALTGAIFAKDRHAVVELSNKLRNSAGNFYVNDKCTGAVVGQQPFGGGRASGTNDKAGSLNLLLRFVSPRTIKETFLPVHDFIYPSNLPSSN